MGSSEITERIIGSAFTVSNTLGIGFLEKVYENALVHELRKSGLNVRRQFPVEVRYDGVIVGDYVADILVEDSAVVELKAVKSIDSIDEAQLLNYLRATGFKVGLILNFDTPHLGIKRMVY